MPALRVTHPTAEYDRDPLGLDEPRPRLSWRLESDEPGQAQTAYRIRVATDPALLTAPDVWDSGTVASDASVLVPYDGPEPRPRTRYFWSVRAWDTAGRGSEWSEPCWWETGLCEPSQWSAQWIGAPAALTSAPDPAGSFRIWGPANGTAGGDGSGAHWFRTVVEVPAPGDVTAARLVVTADGGCTVYVNGFEADHTETDAPVVTGRSPRVVDVTERLRPGANVLAIAAVPPVDGAAGVLGVLELSTADGVRRIPTDGAWRATDREPSDGWHSPGYDDGSWSAATVLAPWGAGPWTSTPPAHAPVIQLRHEFRLADRPVARARLYATALGLYEAHLNGRQVGRDRLAPGWTDYDRRVQYRTHDVTGRVRPGANALAVNLASGWYAGGIGWFGPHHYGQRPALLAQLEVTYEDGSTERVVSAPGWRAAAGPVTDADLMAGEEYDARRETGGWTEPGFDDSGWLPAEPVGGVRAEPVAQLDLPVEVVRELTAQEVTEPRPGVFVFDLGQNMVGSVRLKVSGPAGTTVRLRHAEALNPDGTPYTANLRSARATDRYTLKGGGPETYEPRFTFHGFRYVEVTGYPGTPPPDAVTGLVMHTSAPFTLDFATDVPMLNQLHDNITWGLRGNFVSVPTDTPARDERLGWTGDINVFAPTAAYLMDSARFLTKWLRDLRDSQSDDGAFPDVAPHVGPLGKGVAGWGDAGVTVPWALYRAYGDVRVLERSWSSMLRWLEYLDRHSEGCLRPAEGYGDWLNIDDETPKDVIGTAYYAHSADLVARTAEVLGEDPAPYRALFGRVRDAFRAAYVSAGGRVKGDTQTSYVLALSMDLLAGDDRRAAADRLVELIEARDWHLSTGFLGTPRLLPALTAAGRTDVAHRLLHRRTFPSWGYQIERGATTMWERWDSVRPDGAFQDAGMNSFNHYAYGSVGEWMYAHIAGIAPGAPGFKHLVVRPRPGGGVNEARARFDSPYGPVSTGWSTASGTFRLEVSLPVNTTAEVWITASAASDVAHGSARFLRLEDGCAVFAVGSGTHRFSG
ncbi:glycoside hydrolase family 78 protein [Streptomyces sp. NBC_00825]|uniref:alpha-L-rhamnosidase n=1 Tax=unclassified Streptomyces TaxID=2593676 RepID=UPI002258157D|nr:MULTISPECIES: alpha-L-rhamnosidase [unclassified Streptomyces]WTB58338.1 glycoside hydrolase family 78 protein [Streptomyces sp. NBC_00826]WTH88782.1 glycoside hydrolase family 78 protein [Streptomyces sp. NBC_00825]WTH97512.1 glycoside hydrolase family 78 protein [Streptomyces sp. NBC_00822]MCX4863030.1 glycoside hydrolase family 78 protein [Streptomyces sp. NBC_00906]MCX4894267.1 glycoside hydrolase family 78 protein [Streptomyces sp. NBC_00892]